MTLKQYWIAVGLAIAILIAIMALIINQFAKEHLQFFFFRVRSGTIVIVKLGEQPRRMIMNPDEGSHLNDPLDKENYDPNYDTWEKIPNTWEAKDPEGHPTGTLRVWKDNRSWLAKTFGIHFYWWPIEKIHWYQHTWSELGLDQEKNKSSYEPKTRSEYVGWIFSKQFQYFEQAKELTTDDGTKVDVDYVMFLETTNPYTSLFKVDDYLGTTASRVESAVRNYVGTQTFQELQSLEDNFGLKELYDETIRGLNTQIPGEPVGRGIMKMLGQKIVGLKILRVVYSHDPTGENEKIRALQWQTEEKAKATERAGQAEANVILQKGRAEAEAAKLKLQGEAEGLRDKLAAQTATSDRTRVTVAQELFKNASTVVVGGEGGNSLLIQAAGDGKPKGKS